VIHKKNKIFPCKNLPAARSYRAMRQKVKIQFADFWHGDDKIPDNPLFKLLSKRFELELSHSPDFLLYSCFGQDYLKYTCIRILYTGENLRPNFSECDYAFSFDFPVTQKNYRLPVYKLYDEFSALTAEKDVDAIFAQKSQFCNFIYSNALGRERIRFFKQLSAYKHVDSGGKVCNNIGYRVKDKVDFLQPYKFTITFEHSLFPGYTTEKILHAMVAHTVPIYWGNPCVSRDFNPKSFINCHEYANFDEVIDKVIELDTDDDVYRSCLAEPYFQKNLENDYVNEENILNRFEEIFNQPHITPVAQQRSIRNMTKRMLWRLIPTYLSGWHVFQQRTSWLSDLYRKATLHGV